MIPLELRARIRRLHFAEHWPVGTIAAELGVHHETVQRALDADWVRSGAGRTNKASILAPYRDFIVQTLEEHPRLTASRLFEMVTARGYEGGIAQVRRFVRTARPRKSEAFLRLNTLPGEQGQVDWGLFGKLKVGNAERALCCFVMVLSWSRAVYARFFLDMTMESFMRGHVRAFEALGGVPRELLYDNLKSAVLERAGDAIRFHPRLLELSGHYHFAPKPCAPYRGNEKGRVERTIRYLRDSFFPARRYSSLADLNGQLERWLAEVAYARQVPGDAERRLVRDAWEQERARLLPLPKHPLHTERVEPASSGKTPYIRFDGNDYSIPHGLIREPLTISATEDVVRILHGAAEVARHQRTWDKKQVVEDATHIAALAREKRAAHELRGRDLLRTVCKSAEPFLQALAARGEPLSAHTSRLLALLERYGAVELEIAIADALSRGALGGGAVAHVLDQRARKRKQPPPLEVVLPDDPRIKGIRVAQHALNPYDDLGNIDDAISEHDE